MTTVEGPEIDRPGWLPFASFGVAVTASEVHRTANTAALRLPLLQRGDAGRTGVRASVVCGHAVGRSSDPQPRPQSRVPAQGVEDGQSCPLKPCHGTDEGNGENWGQSFYPGRRQKL